MDVADALTIKTEVLRKRLGYEVLEARLSKKLHCETILLQITRGIALVSIIKEGQEFAFFTFIYNRFPLLWRWIDTSWIMSNCMNQNRVAGLHSLHSSHHTIKIESSRLWFEVCILLRFQP